jgi:hypothetical protein
MKKLLASMLAVGIYCSLKADTPPTTPADQEINLVKTTMAVCDIYNKHYKFEAIWRLLQAYVWIQKDSDGKEKAGAFVRGNRDDLLKKSFFARLIGRETTIVGADYVMPWHEFAQKFPAVAAKCAPECQNTAQDPLVITQGFATKISTPKESASKNSAPEDSDKKDQDSDVVTVWLPSKQLWQAYEQHTKVVGEREKMMRQQKNAAPVISPASKAQDDAQRYLFGC